jgi:thiol-disulfide isomerase/thioredoxin
MQSVTKHFWTLAAAAAVAFVGWRVILTSQSATKPAPHVAYQRLDGSRFALTSEKGRPVFLDFYASWCEPCRDELPKVVAWAQAHPDVVVQPIDVGEPHAVVVAFARRLHLGNVAMDPAADARAAFSIIGFPTIIAIDAHGRIRQRFDGLNPAIEDALTAAAGK